MAGWGLMEARTMVGGQVAFNLNPAATTRTRLNYQPAATKEGVLKLPRLLSSSVVAILKDGPCFDPKDFSV